MIADEPTASLDSTNARAVAELILDTNRTLGTAFLIASHDDRRAPAASHRDARRRTGSES